MVKLADHVRSSYIGLSAQEILQEPVNVLLGVSDQAAQALELIGIKTVFDLGASALFAQAASLVSSAIGGAHNIAGDLVSSDAFDGAVGEVADLDLDAFRMLPLEAVSTLKNVLNVSSIRDFAFWPPRTIAHALVNEDVGTDLSDVENLDAEKLRPRLGEYPTERVYYDTLFMLEAPAVDDSKTPQKYPITLADLASDQVGFTAPVVGALATYSQSWFAQGITLGQMIHSLALAPGEATRIAVVDWSRRSRAAATEDIDETERLRNTMDHSRAISEVQNAVAEEMQEGGSMSSGWAKSKSKAKSGGWSLGGGLAGAYKGVTGTLGVGGGQGKSKQSSETEFEAESTSWSVGTRSVMADMTQNVNDRSEQHASAVRNRRASAVREVSQSEHEEISTRVVANYNHMHALTVQYYEVVQVYRVETKLRSFERVLFIPFALLDFSEKSFEKLVARFRQQLLQVALSERATELLLNEKGSITVRGSKVTAGAVAAASGIKSLGKHSVAK